PYQGSVNGKLCLLRRIGKVSLTSPSIPLRGTLSEEEFDMSHLGPEQGCSLEASPAESATVKPAKSPSGRRSTSQSSGKAGIVAKTYGHLQTLLPRSPQVRA